MLASKFVEFPSEPFAYSPISGQPSLSALIIIALVLIFSCIVPRGLRARRNLRLN